MIVTLKIGFSERVTRLTITFYKEEVLPFL